MLVCGQPALQSLRANPNNPHIAMLTLLLPVLLTSVQQPETATELLPLQQLCERSSELHAPQWHSMLQYVRTHNSKANLVIDPGNSSPITAEGVFNVLEGIENDAISEERLFLNAIGENLLVFGEAERVRAVRKMIHEATDILARPLQIEFCLWDAAGRETPSSILTSEEYESFCNGHKPLSRSLAVGRAGQAIALKQTSWTRYVRSIEVEVAQKKTLSRPATDRFGEGFHAAVRAYPLVDTEDLALHVQFASSVQRGVLRSVQTGLPGAADIELPRLETCFGGCSGRIPNGGALAVTMRGNPSGGGQIVLTLRAMANSPQKRLSDERLALVPCGAITNGALSQRAILPLQMEEMDEHVSHDDNGTYGMISSEALLELAQGIVESQEEAGDYSVHMAGSYLFVKASTEVCNKISALIRTLQDRMVRNVEVAHVAQLRPQENGEAEPARQVLHELTVPTLLGREFVAVRLHETNVIANVYIEIASEAGTLVPSVELLQSGAWLRGRAIPIAGSLHLGMDLLVCNAPIPMMRTVMPGGGMIMPATLSTARLSHDGTVASGQAIEHGDGPGVLIEGRGYGSTMSTTLRH